MTLYSDDSKSMQLQAATVAALNRIASALEAIALTKAPAPNFVRSIADYAAFEFESIGAKVTGRDQHGVTAVEWAGYQWTRRSPSNKFGSAIWFSRAAGKDETGAVRYVRLITFREPTEPEPLPGKVAAQLAVKPALAQPAAPEPPAPIAQPNGRKPAVTYEPTEPETDDRTAWPTTAPKFVEWLGAHNITGAEVNRVLGLSSSAWLRMHTDRTYADLARELAALLAPEAK